MWRPGLGWLRLARPKLKHEEKKKKRINRKKKIVINTNLVFREGSDISLCLLGENVKDNVWAWPLNSHMGLAKNHRAFYSSLSGGCVAGSASRVARQEREKKGRRLSFITRVHGWRGRTLTRRCGFSWSPPPGSWRCRWPGGNETKAWGKLNLIFIHLNCLFCTYDNCSMSEKENPSQSQQ